METIEQLKIEAEQKRKSSEAFEERDKKLFEEFEKYDNLFLKGLTKEIIPLDLVGRAKVYGERV